MWHNQKLQTACALLLGLALPWVASARDNAKLTFSADSAGSGTITILGTSNVKDWEVTGRDIRGHLKTDFSEEETRSLDPAALLRSAPEVKVSVPVNSLGSDSRGMDRNMYDALKASRHDTITFVLTGLRALSDEEAADLPVAADGVVRAKAEGELTLVGVSMPIELPVTLGGDVDRLKIEGEAAITMSDFGIDPPRALFGALRTGDDVIVRFEWSPARAESPLAAK